MIFNAKKTMQKKIEQITKRKDQSPRISFTISFATFPKICEENFIKEKQFEPKPEAAKISCSYFSPTSLKSNMYKENK